MKSKSERRKKKDPKRKILTAEQSINAINATSPLKVGGHPIPHSITPSMNIPLVKYRRKTVIIVISFLYLKEEEEYTF